MVTSFALYQIHTSTQPSPLAKTMVTEEAPGVANQYQYANLYLSKPHTPSLCSPVTLNLMI